MVSQCFLRHVAMMQVMRNKHIASVTLYREPARKRGPKAGVGGGSWLRHLWRHLVTTLATVIEGEGRRLRPCNEVARFTCGIWCAQDAATQLPTACLGQLAPALCFLFCVVRFPFSIVWFSFHIVFCLRQGKGSVMPMPGNGTGEAPVAALKEGLQLAYPGKWKKTASNVEGALFLLPVFTEV